MAERFMVNNYTAYGERFKQLCQALIDDPLCSNHYEYDIQWILLHFLLEMAHKPLNALAGNKGKIALHDREDDDERRMQRERERMRNELAMSLLRNSLESETDAEQSQYLESDLSDWSDDEEAAEPSATTAPIAILSAVGDVAELKLIRCDRLHPPQKPLPFAEFDSTKSDGWLQENVQHSWWQRPDWQATVDSDYDEARMCQKYHDAVKKYSGGVIKLPTVSTVPEWCLLREIIWMLRISDAEIKAKFFSVDAMKSEISANPNVSIASVTTQGIRGTLQEFASKMTKLFRLRQFMRSVFVLEANSPLPPHTIECYANAMSSFLDTISAFLLRIENELNAQNHFETHSIVKLFTALGPHFILLDHLYTIHTKCYIDFRIVSGYECVIHLFGGLLHEMDSASAGQRLNIAASLFLCSIRFYFFKFDNWWSEGRFDDWRNEFVIEKVDELSEVDNFIKNTYRLQAIDDQSNEIIQLICDQYVEAGYIISILFGLDKMGDMRQENIANNEKDFDFYDKFVQLVFDELEKFRFPPKDEGEANASSAEAEGGAEIAERGAEAVLIDDCDPLLSLVFENCIIEGGKKSHPIVTDEQETGLAFYQK